MNVLAVVREDGCIRQRGASGRMMAPATARWIFASGAPLLPVAAPFTGAFSPRRLSRVRETPSADGNPAATVLLRGRVLRDELVRFERFMVNFIE